MSENKKVLIAFLLGALFWWALAIDVDVSINVNFPDDVTAEDFFYE